MSSSFLLASRPLCGSPVRVHALSRKKIFPQNDHFINLFGSLTIFAKDTLLVSSDGEAIRRDGRSRRMTSSSDGNNAKIVKEPFILPN